MTTWGCQLPSCLLSPNDVWRCASWPGAFRLWPCLRRGHTVEFMSKKTQGVLSIIAAFIVLFSAMWEPVVSLTVAIAALLLLGIYQMTSHTGGGAR